jgi:hypothetical protein
VNAGFSFVFFCGIGCAFLNGNDGACFVPNAGAGFVPNAGFGALNFWPDCFANCFLRISSSIGLPVGTNPPRPPVVPPVVPPDFPLYISCGDFGTFFSLSGTFLNFAPFWIELSRAPLPGVDGGGLKAGTSGALGGGGGGGAVIFCIFNYNCKFTFN